MTDRPDTTAGNPQPPRYCPMCGEYHAFDSTACCQGPPTSLTMPPPDREPDRQTVRRWKDRTTVVCEEHPDGRFVLYEDFLSMQTERDQAVEVLRELKGVAKDILLPACRGEKKDIWLAEDIGMQGVFRRTDEVLSRYPQEREDG